MVSNLNGNKKQVNDRNNSRKAVGQIKSPSDTTIYGPALNKRITNGRLGLGEVDNTESVINQISNFVEQMRRSSISSGRKDSTPRCVTTPVQEAGPSGRKPEPTAAANIILDAERFKANVMPPTGNGDSGNQLVLQQNPDGLFQGLTEFLRKMAHNEDDEFFHITCHVGANLKAKIERGEFVDLEKLLPRDRMSKLTDERSLTLINHDGNMFFMPADNGPGKITNVRCWEQAFRVYAAVYSNANPSRPAEIWQYVYVINTAASSFQWENVAYYDFTFRQLMHANPHCSWGKTYVQLWNLAMKDPIQRNVNNQNYGSNSNTNNSNRQIYGDWRDNCCWRYNHGKCKKWNCRFDHRCNYCGAYNHPSVNCYKKKGGKSGNGEDNHRTVKASPSKSNVINKHQY